MEYTITAIVVLIVLALLDYFLKTDVLKPTKRKAIFWASGIIFWYIIEIMAIGRWWVIPPATISGIYLGFNIPIEELGCLIIWFLIILIPWEYFKKHMKG